MRDDVALPSLAGSPSRLRLAVVLAVLTTVNAVNVMDRTILSVLAEPIKREFSLTDTQLGLLTGMAFSVVYGLLALPLSRIADGGLYRGVIVAAVAIWSSLTTLCGLTQSFWQLALMRVGVAGGEAGLTPASHALIARLFPPEIRGRALGIFSLGVPLGAGCGAVLVGAIASAHGWRAAFLVVGPIGLALLPFLLVIPKLEAPPRKASRPSLLEAFELLADRTFFKTWIACALASTFSFGAAAFMAPYFVRVHHLNIAQAGAVLGAISLAGTAAGAFLGGAVFDAVKRRRPGWELYPSAVALTVSAVAALIGWLSLNLIVAAVALTAALFSYALTAVPAMTVAQNLAPPNRRAGASALLGIALYVGGATCGPLLTGLLSDAFHLRAGARALPYALACMSAVQVGGALAYLSAAADLRRRSARSQAPGLQAKEPGSR